MPAIRVPLTLMAAFLKESEKEIKLGKLMPLDEV